MELKTYETNLNKRDKLCKPNNVRLQSIGKK